MENHELTVHESLIRTVDNNLTLGKIYDNIARGVDKDGELTEVTVVHEESV